MGNVDGLWFPYLMTIPAPSFEGVASLERVPPSPQRKVAVQHCRVIRSLGAGGIGCGGPARDSDRASNALHELALQRLNVRIVTC